MNFKVSRITYNPPLSLAMYRELAAHLSQVEGVTTKLVWQEDRVFNYDASQIGSMYVNYGDETSNRAYALAKAILDYYGTWQEVHQPLAIADPAIAI